MNKIIIAKQISAKQYKAFITTVSHSGFQAIELLQFVADFYKYKLFLLGYFDNHNLIAVTPLIRRKIGLFQLWGAPLRKTLMPPSVSFCAPVEKAESVLPALENWVKNNKISYLQICYPSTKLPRANSASQIEQCYNLEVNLSTPFAIYWKNISGKKRYNIRRQLRNALKNNVKIHYSIRSGTKDAYLSMISETYSRQFGDIRPNFPEGLYDKILQNIDKYNFHIFTATHKNKTVSAIWLFEDDDRCYYWDAASSNLGRKLSANHLLAWCTINRARKLQHNTFDFVGGAGGRVPGSRPGIGRFKKLMGATEVPYSIIYWYSPLMGMALSGFRTMVKINKLYILGKNYINDLFSR